MLFFSCYKINLTNKKTSLGLLLFFVITNIFFSQTKVISLWKNVPNAIENKNYVETYQYNSNKIITKISNVSTPSLTLYLVDNNKDNNTAIIVCPGGSYSNLSIEKEGYNVAKWLNSIGISAVVLKYRLPNESIMENKTIGPLQDAQEAVRTLRRNAKDWKLDPNKIGIMGFSAGGHLSSTISTHYKDKVYDSDSISARPDFAILVYPVISMEDGIAHQVSKSNLLGKTPSEELITKYSNEKQVNSNTPPTFLIHATNDRSVPVENSINYYLALKDNNVPVEMHLYEYGGHGFGLGTKGTNTNWPKACEKWLIEHNFIDEKPIYIFSYFKGNGEDGLHLAYSDDAYNWFSLKNDTSFLTPQVGKDKLMRDPCIIKGGDGLYHMVWTVSWTDNGIGYSSSKDLIHWSEQKFIPVMEAETGTRNTWAPEITYDENSKEYLIYWASTITGKFPETQSKEDSGYNHRIYYTTTKDFEQFSSTKLLYEPGFNVIDATIQKDGDKYVMFLKDETKEPVQKNIRIAYSENLKGPYSKASEPITGNYWAEGPTAIKINEDWIVYFDKYKDHQFGAITSKNLKDWKDISNEVKFPIGIRHGSVFKISKKEFKELLNNI